MPGQHETPAYEMDVKLLYGTDGEAGACFCVGHLYRTGQTISIWVEGLRGAGLVQVVVVANPANTNALILSEFASSIPRKNITCLTRLDHNRALGQVFSDIFPASECPGLNSFLAKLRFTGSHKSVHTGGSQTSHPSEHGQKW